MANKYFDKNGKKISKSLFLDRLNLGESYSNLRQMILGDGKIRIAVEWWGGPFDTDTPDEHCNFYLVWVRNLVNGKWFSEPLSAKDRFNDFIAAEKRWLQLAHDYGIKHGEGIMSSTQAQTVIDDLEDYGEPEVPKDIPKTKSAKLGMW